MSGFLQRLLERDRGPTVLRPRLPSRFESLGPGVGREGLLEYRAAPEDAGLATTGLEETFVEAEVPRAVSLADPSHPAGPTGSPLRGAPDGSPPPGAPGDHRPLPPNPDRTVTPSAPEGSPGEPTAGSPRGRSSVEERRLGAGKEGKPAADRPRDPAEPRSAMPSPGTPQGHRTPPGPGDPAGTEETEDGASPPALDVPERAAPIRPSDPLAPAGKRAASLDPPEASEPDVPAAGRGPGDPAGAVTPAAPLIRPRESRAAEALDPPRAAREAEALDPIRIRIGRVDVRAAPQPPRSPAPAPPPPRRPAFSLDDYLRQRSEGRR